MYHIYNTKINNRYIVTLTLPTINKLILCRFKHKLIINIQSRDKTGWW